jgi:transcriptional regulator with XRE-family HTH domain
LAVNQNYVGSIANPIVEARLNQSMTSQVLGKRLGLSKQYVSRAEMGTYSSLNPSLLRWVSNAMGWTNESTIRRYVQFQNAKRRETVKDIAPHQLTRNESPEPGYKIFERWRSGYWPSAMAFASAFCVHPDLVSKYEDGIQKTMPKQIKEVLKEFNLISDNWSDTFVSNLGSQGSRL